MSISIIEKLVKELSRALQGKPQEIKLLLSAFFSKGHLLLEDYPGVGKTSLAKAFAIVMGVDFKRIQCTSDLMPSDIVGVEYYDTKEARFIFKKGPIFSKILLADEINRATPKTQSALLEAMEERQVSIDGVRYDLWEHFFVIGTKNPYDERGTFELPQSQLDRFSLSMQLGFPDTQAERAILEGVSLDMSALQSIGASDIETLFALQKAVFVDEKIIAHLQEISAFTRTSPLFKSGLSIRALLAYRELAKAWAMIDGRDYVTPDDLIFLLPFVVGHRLESFDTNLSRMEKADAILKNHHWDS